MIRTALRKSAPYSLGMRPLKFCNGFYHFACWARQNWNAYKKLTRETELYTSASAHFPYAHEKLCKWIINSNIVIRCAPFHGQGAHCTTCHSMELSSHAYSMHLFRLLSLILLITFVVASGCVRDPVRHGALWMKHMKTNWYHFKLHVNIRTLRI